LAQALNVEFTNIQQYKAWLDTMTDQSLIALGFAQGDVDVLKSAIADLDQLRVLYQGGATLGTAKDFRAFAKQLWRFGFNL
jgi:alpha-D-ribose 1-methylphosphonate 5-phosphate C-P lyase